MMINIIIIVFILSEPHRPGVFGGVGMRLLPEGDPRADRVPEPNASNLRELAGEYQFFIFFPFM